MVARVLPPPVVVLGLSLAVSFYSFHTALARIPVDGSLSWLVAVVLFALAVIAAGTAITAASLGVRWIRYLGRCLLMASLGLAVGLSLAPLSMPRLCLGQDERGITRITGRLCEDASRLEGGRGLLRLELVAVSSVGTGSGATVTSARGPLTVFLPSLSEGAGLPERGAAVVVDGSFREGKQGLLFSGKTIAVVEEAPSLEKRRALMRSAILDRFSGPRWGPLAIALLIGSKDLLENGESKSYTAAGVAHVLALSGMHLALFSLLLSLLLKRPLGVRLAGLVSLALIAFYVYLAGAQPSLLRALFMYGLSVLALLGGYPARILPVLSASFILQLLWDPAAATGLSFTLSYLALLGLILPGAWLDDMGKGLCPDFLRSPVSASLSAFLATAMVSVAVFGCLRPIGLLVGMVLASAANLLMVGAMLWCALDLAHPALAAPLSRLLDAVYDLNLRVVNWGAGISPLAAASLWAVSLFTLAGIALIVYGHSHIRTMRNRVEPVD